MVRNCSKMVVSLKQEDPKYKPQNSIILIIAAPKKIPIILGKPQIAESRRIWFLALALSVLVGYCPHSVTVAEYIYIYTYVL